MHVITRSRPVEFWNKHPDAENSLRVWYKLAAHARWQNFAELRDVFKSADQVKNLTVFNIGGNKHRLIAFIDYASQKVFIRAVLTHAEYDKDDWKKDSWYRRDAIGSPP